MPANYPLLQFVRGRRSPAALPAVAWAKAKDRRPLDGRPGNGKENLSRSRAGAAGLLLLLTAALLSLAACGGGETWQVRGQVIEVSARDFAELETLGIRDDAGREYRFTTEGFVGFTPSHVREHQLLGQSLLVTYEKRGEELVAVALAD